MTAILKHELKSYFHSLTAYVFGAFLLVMVGLGSVYYNLMAAVSNFEYVLSFGSIIFVIIVPLLTMRVIAEERRQKTDQLLYSLPVTTTQVVLGKYLALLAVYLVPLGIISTYPLIEENYYINMPLTQGLSVEDASVSVTALLTTSEESFSKIAGYDLSTYEKEDGDIDGPFAAAVSIDCTNDGQIVWFGSSVFLEDLYNALSSGSNSDLAMNALSDLIGEREALAIRSKSLNYNYLTITQSTASTLKTLMIGVFPLAYLGVGVCVILRRRRAQNEAC